MFSKATEYALRATIYIAQKGTEEKKLGLPEIAKAIDSPRSFTAKILQQLTGNINIISSTRGPNGGFYITEAAKKLPIRAILTAMGEDEMLETCIMGLTKCSEKKPCPMHARYKPIKADLLHLFGSMTIQTMADEMRKGHMVIANG